MKRKPFLIGLPLVIVAAAAVYLLIRSHTKFTASEKEPNTATLVRIQTGTLERKTLHSYVNGYGAVQPASASATKSAADAFLSASEAGVVAKINIAEGQHVRKGDILMELNSSTETAEFAEQEAGRQRELYSQSNTSQRSLQEADSRLALSRIIAPLSGAVVRLNVKVGSAVDLGAVAAEIIDLSRLELNAQIPESEAGQLKVGQEVQVETTSVNAQVSFVSQTVNTNSGAVLARIDLPGDSGLRVGQFVSLRIVTGAHPNCLAVPEESAVTDINGRTVIAVVKGDEATRVPVQTGFRENGWVEIRGANLQPGDVVATVGAYGLPEKTKVQITKPETNESPATPLSATPTP